ncbi:LL-diaminopimelate aminotransferase [Oceanobacillus damuensis]|uniref:LL-diaminopimelate aminotransferase n=1 Tax=Oceanobacillus damuensis TaxID=937928 RepID=UPI000834B3ED|nr:LL-diaminopimelate aminotransferase [Oceanobacillus damuensis]
MPFVSDKVKNLPPYLFSEFQREKKKLEDKGVDVIDLGIGAPDLPAPDFIYDKLMHEARKPENHRYSAYSGCLEFREAIAHFYKRSHGVDLDPETEVLALIGSKEGIHNFAQSVINPGDSAILPDPGYPVYRTAVHLAGGKSVLLPLDAENGYTPLFNNLTEDERKRAKLMFLNYPSNPTAATIELNTFSEAISFASENNMVIANDAAYSLVTYDDYKSPSILEAPNAKDVAVEFGSLSKSFNMAGWRIGFVVGNKVMIHALATLKSNIDTSQFLPVQKAAAYALRSDLSVVKANNRIYKERMEKLYAALAEVGIVAEKPKGTLFIWAQIPGDYSSLSFSAKLLDEAGIIVTPGTAFGPAGEGFIRIALTVSTDRLDEVIRRLKKLDLQGGKNG